jgi:hypothetical protein
MSRVVCIYIWFLCRSVRRYAELRWIVVLIYYVLSTSCMVKDDKMRVPSTLPLVSFRARPGRSRGNVSV